MYKKISPERGDNGPQYGLAIEQARFGGNRIYLLLEGEFPGFDTVVSTDPANEVSFVIWTNLAISVDGEANAKAFALKLLAAPYSTPLDAPTENNP
ncbi:hypothetical protein ACSHWG_09085 [Leucobacter sp. Z1108]|uniref:hypothetical protein n=1 Tax=Leucobacter sp. Z1108 TaxID=3439066 RepID=UPI003F2C042A